MLQRYKELLFASENQWISIGITKTGEDVGAISVPWSITAHAFNMKTPNIYISVEDIYDEKVISQLCKNRVVGCYIFEPIQDYSFVAHFKDLRDIHIEKGFNINDLSFLSNLPNCTMLHFEDLTIDNMNTLYAETNTVQKRDGLCLCFYNCNIGDVSIFEKKDICIYELAVWEPKIPVDMKRLDNIRVLEKNFYLIG